MILSGQSIRKRCLHDALIFPFVERHNYCGMSYGLSVSGYDVRIDQSVLIVPGGFVLASTFERFQMPDDLLGIVHDKSTLARCGLAVQNTIIEAGWTGFLTLELTNHSDTSIDLLEGMPIAQVVFHVLDQPAENKYKGKYNDQKQGPQPALFTDEW